MKPFFTTLIMLLPVPAFAGGWAPERMDVALWKMQIDLMDRLEEKTPVARTRFLNLFFTEAFAGDAGSSCIIAGYIGKKERNRCSFPDGTNPSYTRGGTVTCNPDLFGPGITIETAGTQRWTRACAEATYKKAGVTDRDLKTNPDQQKKLSEYLTKFASDNWYLKKTGDLCKVAEQSGNPSDQKDCKEIKDLVSFITDSEKKRVANSCTKDQISDAGEKLNTCGESLFNFYKGSQSACSIKELNPAQFGSKQNWSKFLKDQNDQAPVPAKPCYPKEFFKLSTGVLSKWINDTFGNLKESDDFTAKTLHLTKNCDIHVRASKTGVNLIVTNLDLIGKPGYEKFRREHSVRINSANDTPHDLASSKEVSFEELANDTAAVKVPHRTLILDILGKLQPACMDGKGIKTPAPSKSVTPAVQDSTSLRNPVPVNSEGKVSYKNGEASASGSVTATQGDLTLKIGTTFTGKNAKGIVKDLKDKNYKDALKKSAPDVSVEKK